MIRLFSFALAFVFISSSLAKDTYLSSFPRCNRDDPEIKACMLKATETVRDQLKKGVREAGFPALSPLVLPKVTVEQGTRNTKFKIILTNTTIRGLDEYHFTEFSFDPKTLKWHGHITFDSISAVSDCDVDGKLFKSELHGKGKVTAMTGPCEGTFEISGELVKRDDKEYYHIVDGDMDFKVSGGTAHVDEFSSTSEEFANVANQLISNNAEDLIQEMRPSLKKLAVDTLKEMVERISKKVPYDNIFPLSNKENP